jgi:hypothetical protein
MKAYVFEVELRKNRDIKRIIEVRADQTLDRLHEAIQASLGWGNDHLYSFFFSPRPKDIEYIRKGLESEFEAKVLNPQEWEHVKLLAGSEARGKKMEYSFPFELEAHKKSTRTRLSSLGLTTKLRFEYLFDFGDDHWFDIGVVGELQAKSGIKYPRVVGRKGKSPEQYPS